MKAQYKVFSRDWGNRALMEITQTQFVCRILALVQFRVARGEAGRRQQYNESVRKFSESFRQSSNT